MLPEDLRDDKIDLNPFGNDSLDLKLSSLQNSGNKFNFINEFQINYLENSFTLEALGVVLCSVTVITGCCVCSFFFAGEFLCSFSLDLFLAGVLAGRMSLLPDKPKYL